MLSGNTFRSTRRLSTWWTNSSPRSAELRSSRRELLTHHDVSRAERLHAAILQQDVGHPCYSHLPLSSRHKPFHDRRALRPGCRTRGNVETVAESPPIGFRP